LSSLTQARSSSRSPVGTGPLWSTVIALTVAFFLLAAPAQASAAAQLPGAKPATVAQPAGMKSAVAAKPAAKRAAVSQVKSGPTQHPRLIIPRLRLNAPIGSTADRKALARGPAHISGTSQPGESGNVGISGHRTMFTRPFNRLNALRPGDLIILGIPAGQVRYRVAWTKVVKPQAVGVLAATKTPSVTLTTCTPVGSAKYRLVVRAELAES